MTAEIDPTHPATAGPMNRRHLISLLGVGGVSLLAACATARPGGGSGVASTTSAASATTGGGSGDLTTTPSETGGPFPADGTNDNGDGAVADVLGDARSIRADIRADLDGTNTQDGVPLTLKVKVLKGSDGSPLAGAAVYVWHCNRAGEYSGYRSSMLGGDFSDRSFLRGVQVADANGGVSFQTILPGRYQGRAFHIHFEVFSDATYATKLLTSQMAMDDVLVDSLYAHVPGYEQALRNDTDNADDGIFGDGVGHQLLEVSGDVSSGLTASFTAVV
jgi:protocatechuate 3,4-dioxygenase beta subunit